MTIMKKFTAIILVILMMIGVSLALGTLAVDAGSGSRSVRDALDKSGIVAEMVKDSLEASTVNMGGEYGDKLSAVMESEAMGDFFTEYISEEIRSTLYGNEHEEIATDELLAALAKGIAQVNAEGRYSISPDEQALFLLYIKQASPDLTAGLGAATSGYEAITSGSADETLSEAEGIAAVQRLMSPMFRAGLGAGILLLIILLVLVEGRRARGMVYAGLGTLVPAGLYGLVYSRGIGQVSGASDLFMNTLVKDGAGFAACAGGIAGILLLILGVIMAIRSRG